MKPMSTGQGIFYATLAVIGAVVAYILIGTAAIIGIGLYWGHP